MILSLSASTRSLMMPRKTVLQSRLACDRCHSQKLRCPRQDKTAKDTNGKSPPACVRCERAKVPCVFSPRQRRTVIPKSAGVPKPTPPNRDIADSADATPASTGPALTKTTPTVPENSEVNFGSFVEGEIASCRLDKPLEVPSTTATLTDTQQPFDATEPGQDFYGSAYFDGSDLHLQQSSTGSSSDPSTTCTDICPLSLDTAASIDWDSLLLLPDLLPPPSQGWSLLNFDKSLLPAPAPDPLFPPHGPQLSFDLMTSSSTNNNDIDTVLFLPSPGLSVDYSNPQALTPYSPVRQLANLNVSLYEHLCLIPQLYSNRGLPALTPVLRIDVLEKRLLAIDRTFQLTQELIDIVGKLYPRSGPLAGDAPTIHRTGTGVPLAQDPATVLLLLSCAQRVCDVYGVMLSHMRKCMKRNSLPHFDEGLKPVRLPPFRVAGVYAPPTDKAVTLHMFMVMMMASNLFDQLKEVLGLWRHNELGVEVDDDLQYPDFGREAKEAIREKARDVTTEIVSIRQIIMSFPGMGMEETRQGVLELRIGGGASSISSEMGKVIGEAKRLAIEGAATCAGDWDGECY